MRTINLVPQRDCYDHRQWYAFVVRFGLPSRCLLSRPLCRLSLWLFLDEAAASAPLRGICLALSIGEPSPAWLILSDVVFVYAISVFGLFSPPWAPVSGNMDYQQHCSLPSLLGHLCP